MLNSAAGHRRSSSARSATSLARTWRPSGRGCTVIPSAPASSASTAAWVTLGIPIDRVLRTRATLFRFTLRAVMAGPSSRLEFPQVLQDAPRVQRLAAEMVANHPAQQTLGFGCDAFVVEAPGRHREQRAARHPGAVVDVAPFD